MAAEREQNLRLRSQPNLLQPVSTKENINKSQSTNCNSLLPDPFEIEPYNSLNSIILPSQSKTYSPSQPDPSKTKPDNLLESFMFPNQSKNHSCFWPDSSETQPNNSLVSFMHQSQSTNFTPLWPDPFKMEPDKSSASFLLQPAIHAVSLPGPPIVQNPVVRSGSGQRTTANRTANGSLNEVDKKLNMSALDDIVCFPSKLNTKDNFSLNSKQQAK